MLLEHSIHVHVCMYIRILYTHVASNTSLALNLSQVYMLWWQIVQMYMYFISFQEATPNLIHHYG